MSRDKQIEEMAKAICSEYDCIIPCRRCDYYEYANCRDVKSAAKLYDAGYRKSTDLAEEIFAEIDKLLAVDRNGEANLDVRALAELKKKYTEVAKRREDIENSPVDCLTPSVTDSKGERNEH